MINSNNNSNSNGEVTFSDYRTVILKSLVGSHNYNLNHENSDWDYEYIVLPSFNDLYKGKFYTKHVAGTYNDVTFHDVRKLPNQFFKSNVNFLEILFSKEITSFSLSSDKEKIVNDIISYKDDIARINLRYLYNSCAGMFMSSFKKAFSTKLNSESDENDYSYKDALRAYRSLYIIIKFAETNFKNFEKSIRYNGHEREFMLDIINGKFKKDELRSSINNLYELKFKSLKNTYNVSPDHKLNDKLKHMIKKLVMLNMESIVAQGLHN